MVTKEVIEVEARVKVGEDIEAEAGMTTKPNTIPTHTVISHGKGQDHFLLINNPAGCQFVLVK